MRPAIRRPCLYAIALLCLPGVASGAGSEPPLPGGAGHNAAAATGETRSQASPDASGEGPAITVGRRTWRLFPNGHLYQPYVADPRQTRFGVMRMSYSEAGIADSGTDRFGLKLGGRFGVLKVHPRNQPDRGWQLEIEAGFHGQFDNDHSQDNIGWDGIYGLVLTSSAGPNLRFKLGAVHTSSHVGDEIAERTGRRRINYTRQELVAGLSWAMSRRTRAYAEGGWGYDLRNEDLQEPGRGQLGVEYQAAESLWRGRLGWYAAVDVSASEERQWQVDTSLQAGLVVVSRARRWRLGVEHYDGRAPIGEFFQDDETYTAFGLWLDL